MENHESAKQHFLSKAEQYCARAEHCATDVQRKLQQWGADENMYDEIVNTLYQNNYINDERFCQAFVHDKLQNLHWGKVKIQAALQVLQLPDNAIEQAIHEIDEQTYIDILQKVAQQRNAASKEQLYRFLVQRGFDEEDILAHTRVSF